MKKYYSLRNGLTVYEDDQKSSEKSNVEDEFHKADSCQIFRGYSFEKVKSFSVRSKSNEKSNVPLLENPINDNKRNSLEVISSQKPMAIDEKFKFQKKFAKSNYVLEFASCFLEQNEFFVSGQLSKWQNDCKLFSQNMLASRQEVILKFVCLLNEAEIRAFFNRADSLKIKLGKLQEKYLQIQTNLAQINKHVNENSVVLYHRHLVVFLNVLYFTKPSWILFPKNIILGDNLDVVSYENLNETFPSKTGVACISSTSKISDNFHRRGLIFDHENSKYASKKLILNSELNLLPLFCNTSIKEVNNDEYQTDINSIISSDIDLITELQNVKQLLSHIENTYNLVKKRLESSLFIKFLALKNKNNNTLSESSEEDIHSELDYKLMNNSAQDISDIEKLDNIRSSYTDMFHSSNDETELYYNPEVFLDTHANDDFKGEFNSGSSFAKIQCSKAIRNGKSITYKSIITKPSREKLTFRFLDPLSDLDDEILKIQVILSRLEEKYDIIENEVFLWFQNTENSAENDFISFDKDNDNLNNNFYENNDKKGNCLMRFKAGNFYDWNLDDFESSYTKLPKIMEEETSESELDDTASSLDGSYKSWRPDSRALTSSEDSNSLPSTEISHKRRNKCTKFKTDKFSGNLNTKLEANLSVTSKSTDVNSDHFGFVSVLLHNLQRLCNSEDIIGAKNQSVNDYILKDIKY